MGHSLFPVLVLIFVIARAFLKASQNTGGGPTPRPPTPGPAPRPTESDAERQRRFMEAVGLPVDAPVPPPVRPRTTINPPPLQQVKPQPVLFPPIPAGRLRRVPPIAAPGRSRPQPAAQGIPSPPQEPPKPPSSAPVPAAPVSLPAPLRPTGSLAVGPATPTRKSYPAGALLQRLRDPATIREAIILREILGPPKALQPG